MWRVAPKWFGYKFVPRKEKLSDGTVVAVVRVSARVVVTWESVELTPVVIVLGQKDRLTRMITGPLACGLASGVCNVFLSRMAAV